MGLIRLLLLLLLAWVIWQLIRKALVRPTDRQPPAESGMNGQRMVRCQQCGVHVPEALALWHDDRSFCSKEHQHDWLEQRHD